MDDIKDIVKELEDLAKDKVIMIVDDDHLFLDIIDEILSRFFKEVICFESPLDALESYHQRKNLGIEISLVISDLTMPVVCGLEFANRIFEIEEKQPFMIVSAHDDSSNLIEAIDVGIDSFLIKPISFEKLTKKICDILKKSKEKKERALLERVLAQQSKMASMGEMISAIAHQWRQPISNLSSILMHIENAYKLKTLNPELMEKNIKDANELLEYMSETIDDFRTFFKPQKRKDIFFIKDTIKKCISISKNTLDLSSLNIVVDIDDKLEVVGFKNELVQVFINLVSNSLYATKERGLKTETLYIREKTSDELVIIEFADTCGGIKKEIVDRIFEPYFTTHRATGTGIGLYMSKIIIENLMFGEIYAKNNDIGGVTLSIKLPRS